jgi:hypothetical protein
MKTKQYCTKHQLFHGKKYKSCPVKGTITDLKYKMIDKTEESMKNQGIIHHSGISHPVESRHDCLSCIDTEIEFLQVIKKEGGVTKLIEQLQKENQ